ncbi:hypothetical protein QTP70_002267 [Hemibagrus guttatus]|uniref:Endonuclease/exonuclease/phosphatase domain-containing protein n=1 Tax=Hemibagrus guttatus TaxID=175788 RepID=A0AAE0Q2H9_9TELE|nr:hypothetical protein QTP70_002267 [Hemibagrus guttatus]
MCLSESAPREKRERSSVREASELFLKHTTFHGLRHVFLGGSYPRRAAWLIAFLASLALLVAWSSNRVRYLLSSPVHTKAHVVYATRLVFPAVTICNRNLLLPRRMSKPDIFSAGRWLGLLGKNRQVSAGAVEALGTREDSSTPFRALDFSRFLPPPREAQPSMRQLLDRLGHQLEEMLLYCRFQGERCGPRNFSTIFTRYGKCYTFNSGLDGQPLRITTKGGMGNGLELMLDIQQDEYLPVWGETEALLCWNWFRPLRIHCYYDVENVMLQFCASLFGQQIGESLHKELIELAKGNVKEGNGMKQKQDPKSLIQPCIEDHCISYLNRFSFPPDETSFEAGIKVQIHTQDEPPFIDQLGFGVAPGFQTFVSCQEQRGAGGNWATVGRRSRGGRRVRRQREKRKGKSVGLRIGTLNVGTMTGKGRELADVMERRKVDILCVQETRWKGSKARSIGAGFKLFYYGMDSKRNGVGVVLKEEFVRNVLEVKRVSDRVMSLKLEIEGVMLNVVSGYAPQVGCELEEKERFWSELDEVMESIPTGERVVIGTDFNGHVGEGNTGDEEVMGKFGVKERNLEGQMVVDFAKRMDMGVVNTYFQKREEHRVT